MNCSAFYNPLRVKRHCKGASIFENGFLLSKNKEQMLRMVSKMSAVFIAGYFLLFTFVEEGLCSEVEVIPAYSLVQVGEPILFHCKSNGKPIENCNVDIPGLKNGLVVRANTSYQYIGASFEDGHCAYRIEQATEANNGFYKCKLQIKDDVYLSEGNMTVVVAHTPSRPKLVIYPSSWSRGSYKEGEYLVATCNVTHSRPVTYFKWFLDEEVLDADLSEPNVTSSEDNLLSTEQRISRVVQSIDNGKKLRCVADHIGLNDQDKEDRKLVRVLFGPKSSQKTFEQFGMIEGEYGTLKIAIKANPKPVFSWTIEGETIVEGGRSGRYEVLTSTEKVGDSWETTLVISSLTKEDISKEYKVEAMNDFGQETYTVIISTGPEPETSIGGGTVVIFLIVILIVLIVIGGVLFRVRSKGKWSFSGTAAPRLAGESSDTESADHTTSDTRKKAGFISVFIKNRDKVLSNIGEENKGVAVVDDDNGEDKINTQLQQLEGDTTGNRTTVQISPQASPVHGEGVVYAELDLLPKPNSGARVVRGDDEKTEYAEIIHTRSQ